MATTDMRILDFIPFLEGALRGKTCRYRDAHDRA